MREYAAVARPVRVETVGCGHASATSGAGVIVDEGQVLTVAHVLAGSSAVSVMIEGDILPADIEAFDPTRDLALLRVPGLQADRVELGEFEGGEGGQIVSGGPSATVDFIVVREVTVEIDVVRSADRATRQAYEVSAATTVGDSGAGAFRADGSLTGVVFAKGTESSNQTWITTAEEIRAFLADQTSRGHYACNEAASRLIAH